jgi:hypothetical protein
MIGLFDVFTQFDVNKCYGYGKTQLIFDIYELATIKNVPFIFYFDNFNFRYGML